MNDITLVNQAENASNGVTSCSLTLENCTVGNTFILAYAVRGTGNIPTLTDGWELVGGGNVASDPDNICQKIYFAKKMVASATETVTVTQTTTGRIFLVCGEFSGDFSVVMRDDMANRGTSKFTVTATKDNANNVILYAVSSTYYSSGRLQSCEPSDLAKLQGNVDREQLACWFDDGSGEVSHTFKTCNNTEEHDAIVECVQLVIKTYKYLVRNNDVIYTVSDGALKEVTGTLNSQLFNIYGVDEIPSSTLLIQLSSPEVLCWKDSEEVPKLTATVIAMPKNNQQIITNAIDLTHSSITGIESAIADCDGELIIAVSFDNKQTWKAWNGETWLLLSEEFSGMSKETLESITLDQWNLLYSGATSMYLRVSFLDTTQVIRTITIDFSN